MNVLWETVKAKWPENSPCMELIRGPGPGGPSASGYDKDEFREGADGAEMTMLNNGEQGNSYGDQKHVTMAEDSFSYQRSG